MINIWWSFKRLYDNLKKKHETTQALATMAHGTSGQPSL